MARSRTSYGHRPPPAEAGVGFLEVGDGLFAKVDDDVHFRAAEYRWSLRDNGEPHTKYKTGPNLGDPYGSVTLKAFVMGVRVAKGYAVKNLDGNPLDCRRANLAVMTLSEARDLDRRLFGPTVRKPRRKERMRLSRFTKEELEQQKAARASAKRKVTSVLG